MKDIKELDKVYSEYYDIKVNRYLTYAQIQQIIDAVKSFDVWSERQQNIDILVVYHVTDISKEEIEKYGHDKLLASGLIDFVKEHVENINQVYEGLEYTESTSRALTQILRLLRPYLKETLNGANRHKK